MGAATGVGDQLAVQVRIGIPMSPAHQTRPRKKPTPNSAGRIDSTSRQIRMIRFHAGQGEAERRSLSSSFRTSSPFGLPAVAGYNCSPQTISAAGVPLSGWKTAPWRPQSPTRCHTLGRRSIEICSWSDGRGKSRRAGLDESGSNLEVDRDGGASLVSDDGVVPPAGSLLLHGGEVRPANHWLSPAAAAAASVRQVLWKRISQRLGHSRQPPDARSSGTAARYAVESKLKIGIRQGSHEQSRGDQHRRLRSGRANFLFRVVRPQHFSSPACAARNLLVPIVQGRFLAFRYSRLIGLPLHLLSEIRFGIDDQLRIGK